MNYYSHHIGDYRRDTAHLSLLEHGVYRQLLDMYYLSEQAIPEETEVVFRRLCARTDEEKNAVQTVLNEFFELANGWVHKRCAKEIEAYQGKAERARANGKQGGRPKKTNEVISRNPEQTEVKANHKPITNNHKPIKEKTASALATRLPDLFPEIEEQIVADFKAMRAKQKAPITKTAIDGIAREAAKAGLTLEGALRICCERNWRGFKADWVLSAAKPTNQSGAWWASEATILAKGEEMGMRPNPGEAMTQFKGRIDAAIASIGKPKVVQATRILPAPEKHDTRTFKPASVDLLSLVKGRASA